MGASLTTFETNDYAVVDGKSISDRWGWISSLSLFDTCLQLGAETLILTRYELSISATSELGCR